MKWKIIENLRRAIIKLQMLYNIFAGPMTTNLDYSVQFYPYIWNTVWELFMDIQHQDKDTWILVDNLMLPTKNFLSVSGSLCSAFVLVALKAIILYQPTMWMQYERIIVGGWVCIHCTCTGTR